MSNDQEINETQSSKKKPNEIKQLNKKQINNKIFLAQNKIIHIEWKEVKLIAENIK